MSDMICPHCGLPHPGPRRYCDAYLTARRLYNETRRREAGMPPRRLDRTALVAIRARIALRRRRGGDVVYVRCPLPRRPEGIDDDYRLAHQIPCGALVVAGEEADHARDVHGTTATGDWPRAAETDDDEADAA